MDAERPGQNRSAYRTRIAVEKTRFCNLHDDTMTKKRTALFSATSVSSIVLREHNALVGEPTTQDFRR
jgi:hypothetical protein